MPFDSTYTEHHVHGDDSRKEKGLKAAGKNSQTERTKANWLTVLPAEKWRIEQVFLDAAERKTGVLEIALSIVIQTCERTNIANRVDDDSVGTKGKQTGTQDDHDIHSISYVVDLLCRQSSWCFWRRRSLRDINATAEAFDAR